MGNPSFSSVINKIKNSKDYQGLFKRAFNGKSVSIVTIGQAFASYQRTLISANANFDKWYYGGYQDTMSKQAKLGFELFTGKAGCYNCHSINKKHALLTDNKLHNTGVGYLQSMSIASEITQNPNDRWKYNTPSLRNINLTAPYMHNGSLLTLKSVVNFYNKGCFQNSLLSPLILPLNLNGDEISALVDFLKNLTGDNVNYLVEDAFSALIW